MGTGSEKGGREGIAGCIGLREGQTNHHVGTWDCIFSSLLDFIAIVLCDSARRISRARKVTLAKG